MKASFEKTEDKVTKKLEGLLDRSKSLSSYLNRNFYQQYKNLQRNRWMTENASEGQQWEPVTPEYAQYKIKKYSGYPGGGQKLMIRTGVLAAAAQGDYGSFKLTEERSITVGIDDSIIPYAKYAAKKRPFMKFSDASIAAMREGVIDFLKGNLR